MKIEAKYLLFLDTGEESLNPDQNSNSRFYSFDYYSKLFDVDTNQVYFFLSYFIFYFYFYFYFYFIYQGCGKNIEDIYAVEVRFLCNFETKSRFIWLFLFIFLFFYFYFYFMFILFLFFLFYFIFYYFIFIF